MDSPVKSEDLHKPVGLWPCHNQGGNQVTTHYEMELGTENYPEKGSILWYNFVCYSDASVRAAFNFYWKNSLGIRIGFSGWYGNNIRTYGTALITIVSTA